MEQEDLRAEEVLERAFVFSEEVALHQVGDGQEHNKDGGGDGRQSYEVVVKVSPTYEVPGARQHLMELLTSPLGVVKGKSILVFRILAEGVAPRTRAGDDDSLIEDCRIEGGSEEHISELTFLLKDVLPIDHGDHVAQSKYQTENYVGQVPHHVASLPSLEAPH